MVAVVEVVVPAEADSLRSLRSNDWHVGDCLLLFPFFWLSDLWIDATAAAECVVLIEVADVDFMADFNGGGGSGLV